jgi:hypothetical protein
VVVIITDIDAAACLDANVPSIRFTDRRECTWCSCLVCVQVLYRSFFNRPSSNPQPWPIMPFDLASLPPAWQIAVLEGPALRPPPGVQPNFIDPSNQNSLGYALIIICGIVSTVMTGTRLYAKFRSSRKLGIEDCRSSFEYVELELTWTRPPFSSAGCIRRVSLHLFPDCGATWSLRPSVERQTEGPFPDPLRKFSLT